jgi:polyphosphate glucokinase
MSDIHTLAFDVGGTGLKAAIIDSKGHMVGERARVPTPYPCPPEVLLDAMASLAAQLGKFERISIGFPGIVRNDTIITAPHFGNDVWHNFPLAAAVAKRLGKPAHALNDAEVQAWGAISGKGLEFVMTLGTGLGTALFRDGEPMPHMEFSQFPFRKDVRFNDYVGNTAMREVGAKKWSHRVAKIIPMFKTLFYYDRLYIGGGNGLRLPPEIVGDAILVPNEMGLTGGIHLWDKEIATQLRAKAHGTPKPAAKPQAPAKPKAAAAPKAPAKTAPAKPKATAKPKAAAAPAARKKAGTA